MKVGIIISTDEPETCWNALRFANFALKSGDQVKVFLLGRGVDYEKTSSEKFDAAGQARLLLNAGGVVQACGTCLKSRGRPGSELCPMSTMQDMYDIVKGSDKVLTF